MNQQHQSLPGPPPIPALLRSLLFVPATNRKLLESAVRRGADAIQLDLEDAIAPAEKDRARTAAAEAIAWLQGRTPYVSVRINQPLRLAVRDLEAVVRPGLDAITLPKVPDASFVQWMDATIGELETERGLTPGAIGLIAMIETAKGLASVNAIATASPRLVALTVGPEDLAADLGAQPSPDAMYLPNMLALIAARQADIIPLGYLGSISQYQDVETYRTWIERAATLGFEGAFCIHPNQVAVCNACLRPTPDTVAEARRLVDAFEEHAAQGVGVFALDGHMIDAPIVARARTVLAKADAIAEREEG